MSSPTDSTAASQRFSANVETIVHVEVHNPDVIERVTGTGGTEWRSQFYNLYTAHDVIEHLAFNYVRNGVDDISRLEGWSDLDSSAVSFHRDDVDVMVADA
jgi:hypothetical protein